MLNSAVLDTMMNRLGTRTALLMRAKCLVELNLAIRELERGPTKPWFLQTTLEGVLVADQDYLAAPADFLTEVEDGTFEILNNENFYAELEKVQRDFLRSRVANELPAVPEVYALWGNRFYFGPTPDDAYVFRYDYFARSTPMVDNGAECTNSWVTEFFDLITYKALIPIARDHIQSATMAANFQSGYSIALDAFRREITAREVANETLLLTNEES